MSSPLVTVLHVVGGMDLRGGAASVAIDLASIQLSGIESAVWMHRDFRPSEGGPTFVTAGRVSRVGSIATDFRSAFREMAPLCSWVRGRRAVLHAHSRFGIFASCLVGRLSGVPVVIHIHALPNHPCLYRWLRRLAPGIMIYNSRKTCCHFGDDPATAQILMPSIQWPAEPAVEVKGRSRFVAAGAFVPSKHFHLLVEAFRHLQSEGLDARLVIFGLSDSPLDRDHQQTIITACRRNESICLEQWAPNWSSRLTSGDIFVHLGKPESFGIVLLEAFARGCRLVILPETFVDDLPDPVRYKGVYRVKEFSPRAIGEAMKDASQGVDSTQDLWQDRESMRRLFSAEGSSAALSRLYHELVGRTAYDNCT